MGGLLTTATDCPRFPIEVIDPKPGDGFRPNQASLQEMLRPQVKVEDGPGYSISWALGWKVAQTVFHSIAEFSVAGKSGYVIPTN